MPANNDEKGTDSPRVVDLGAELLGLPESAPLTSPYRANQQQSVLLTAQQAGMQREFFHTNALIALPYRPDPQYRVQMLYGLNRKMFMQAVMMVPLAICVLMLPFGEVAYLMAGFHDNIGLLFSMVLSAVIGWRMGMFCQQLVIAENRPDKSLRGTVIPDRVMLSADGIKFLWSGRFDRFSSGTLRWSKIRLVYLEKPNESEDGHFFICIRNSSGGVLKLHTSGFGDPSQLELFFQTLRQRVPAAFKDAPLYLAVQPEQKSNLAYVIRSVKQYLKITKPSKIEEFLTPDTVLQDGRYRLLARLETTAECTRYVAEANDPDVVDSRLAAFCEGKSSSKFGAQKVLLEEYILPPKKNMMSLDYLELQSLLEHRARVASRLDNKRILRWLDIFQENQRMYCVFEYFAGDTLHQHVLKNGSFTESQTIKMALFMCDLLSLMHGEEPAILHGSFNPHSLSITDAGELKMTTLPRSGLMESRRLPGPAGRLAYMAPEQLHLTPCKQSDLYGLGATLYFMLTGQDPPAAQCLKVKQAVPSVSDTLSGIIERCTDPDLGKRLENVDVLKRQLIQSEAEHLITRMIS